MYPGPAKEIGWAPVTLTEEGRRSPLAHIDGAQVLHWHGDTFDLPKDAVRLASTALTPNQAFSIDNPALGLQFHLESCGRALERWFVGHAEIAATPGVNVQSLSADTERFSAALERCGRFTLHASFNQAL